jgi:uncharacterized protein (UPF0371 family)
MLFDPKWDAKLRTELWRQVLLDAADYIDRVGWCQHSLRDDNGRVCAAEALMTVGYTAHDVATYAAAMTALSNFVTSGEHSMALVKWNDDERRTAAEVTCTMRACAGQ